jgi:uncharacterized protein (TIGR02145 family)
MKSKIFTIIIFCLFAATAIQAQDFARAGAALSAASEAYESGDFRTAISSVAAFEQALGKGTAYSHYLKIMSYYQLKDYENCIQQVRKYQNTTTEEDDYFAEIQKIYTDAQAKAAQTATIPNSVLINGVKWATRNVDAPGTFAARPEDAGKFYQWNRRKAWAVTGSVSGWNSNTPSGSSWTKANDPSPAGYRLPTHNELKSLLDESKVTNEWTTQNGITGRKFTDKSSGKSIFLPAVGERGYVYGTLNEWGEYGRYWSSTQDNDYNYYAYGLYISSGSTVTNSYLRGGGFSVRSVAE